MREKLQTALNFARAIREFDTTKTISEKDWQALLDIARQAPSSQGREAWKIIQVDSQQLRQQLLPVSPGMTQQLQTADKFIFFTAQKAAAYPHDARLLRLTSAIGANTDALITTWSQRQAFIPLGQMLLAAGLLGIDCCPMEGFDVAAATEILAKTGAINPEKEILTVAAAFGYRKENPATTKQRRQLNDIVTVI